MQPQRCALDETRTARDSRILRKAMSHLVGKVAIGSVESRRWMGLYAYRHVIANERICFWLLHRLRWPDGVRCPADVRPHVSGTATSSWVRRCGDGEPLLT